MLVDRIAIIYLLSSKACHTSEVAEFSGYFGRRTQDQSGHGVFVNRNPPSVPIWEHTQISCKVCQKKTYRNGIKLFTLFLCLGWLRLNT